jgi:Spy/CpxP family protein refolding chaperone
MLNIRTALTGLLIVGSAAAVRAQQPTAPAPKAHAGRGMRAGGPGMGAERALLRGITLSDAEKANLKAVRAKYATQFKAIRAQYKPQHEQIRAARQRGDTAAARALMQQNSGERDQMRTLMQSERTDLRAALSAENQAKFDANAATLKKRLAERGGKGRSANPVRTATACKRFCRWGSA